MTHYQANELHRVGKIFIPTQFYRSSLPSATDPTQDLPLCKVQLAANGEPLNCRKTTMSMSHVPIEKMTSLDRRFNDKFDRLGELQALEHDTAKNVQQFKLQQKHEE